MVVATMPSHLGEPRQPWANHWNSILTMSVHQLEDVPDGLSDHPGRMVDDVRRGLGWPLWVEADVSGGKERASWPCRRGR